MRSLLLAWAAALTVTTTAGAARAPTRHQRTAILRALPADIRAIPARCVAFTVRLSDTGVYAIATPHFYAARQGCARYASNGYWILRHASRWRIVFTGSDLPRCSLGVPHDLTPCMKL